MVYVKQAIGILILIWVSLYFSGCKKCPPDDHFEFTEQEKQDWIFMKNPHPKYVIYKPVFNGKDTVLKATDTLSATIEAHSNNNASDHDCNITYWSSGEFTCYFNSTYAAVAKFTFTKLDTGLQITLYSSDTIILPEKFFLTAVIDTFKLGAYIYANALKFFFRKKNANQKPPQLVFVKHIGFVKFLNNKNEMAILNENL